MKKTLLLFAMLLGVVGAWAEVVFPEEGKYYVIKNFRSSKYATFMYGDNSQLRQKANTTANAIWYVTDVATLNGGGISCKLHNAATESIYAANNSFTATGVTVYIKENPHKTGYVCVSTTEDLSSNCWDDADRNLEIGSIGNYHPRSNDYDGTSWTFVDVTDQVNTGTAQYSFTKSLGQVISGSYNRFVLGDEYTIPTSVLNMQATLSNTVFENNTLSADIVYPFHVSDEETTNKLMINGYQYNSQNFKMYVKENSSIKVDKDLDPTKANVDNYLWAIYPNLEDGTYTIKNIATDEYIYTDKTSGSHAADALSLSDTPTKFNLVKDKWGYSFKVDSKSLYLSINSSNTSGEQPVGVHGNTHAGSSFGFIPYVILYTLTDAANNVYTGEYEGWSGFDEPGLPTFTGVEYTLTNEAWNGNQFTADIEFNNLPFPVSSETKINPTMISSGIGTWTSDVRKWYASEVGVLENGDSKRVSVIGTKKDQVPTDANRMTYMWAIYPKLNKGAFTFQVKNLATDTYVYSTSDAQTHNLGTVTLAETGADFTFENNSFKLKSTTDKYLSINSSTATGVQYIGTWTYHGGCNLSFPTVEDVNLELVPFIKSEIEGYEETNPNTHLGTVSIMNGTFGNQVKLSANNSDTKKLYLDLSSEVSLAHTRNYRGYEFLGFWLGETKLDETPLTAEQVNAISETNPIIAKYEVIPGEVTLFYDDDAFSYRIPAIAKTSTGRLIAVSDYRHNLDDIGRDNHGTGTKRIDLVARTSEDNGKTWSPIKTIAAGDNSKTGTYERAFGDAAIVAVGEKVVVMAAAGDQVYTGANASSPNRMVRIFSSDNGENWSISEITTKMYNSETSLIPNGVAAFFGSGKLVVDEGFNGTETNRIYGALLVRIGTNNYNNFAVYSDDLGENWKILGGSTTPIANGDEPKVEILPSGQILLSARRGGGRVFNVFTYGIGENDKANGSGTWSGTANGCGNGGSNATNGEIFLVDAKKVDGTVAKLLLQSQPKGGSDQYDRKDVTIWYKEISDQPYTHTDIANGWTEGLQVSEQKSAYSAMTLQQDGKIAFFFEEAPCYADDHTKGYSMVYVPLTIEEITKDNYADKNAQAKNVEINVTDEYGNTYNEVLSVFAQDEEAIKNLIVSKWAFVEFGEEPTLRNNGTSYTYTNTITLPFKVSNNENTYWHNIYFPSNGNGATEKYPVYMSSDETTTLKISTEKLHYGYSSLNTKDNADKISWAIYQKGNGFAFKFKNKLNNQYIKTEDDAVTGKAQNVKYTENAEEATAFDIVDGRTNSYVGEFGISTNGGQLIVYGVGDGYVSYSTAIAHQGAWVKFVEAPDFDWHIEAVNRELSAIGTAVGLYATDDDVEAARTAMTSANTVKWNTLKGYYENIRRDGREVNAPSVGMYRIKNKNTGAYIHGNANGTISLASKFDNYTSIFYLNENNQLISYRMGRHLDGQAKNLAEVNTACDVEFNVAYGGVTEGVLTIKSNGAWIGYTIYPPTIESSTVGTQSAAYDWTFEKVEWLPVPVNTSVGYATLYSPVALNTFAPNTQNHRVEAYIGTIKGDRFSMEQVDAKDGIIPAKTPVILVYKQDAENGLVYLQVVNSDEEAPAENELRGTFESSYIEDDAYVLSAPEGKLGLYMADKNFYENNGTWTKDTTIGTHFLNNGFKAYLPAPAGTDARFFLFDFSGEETGITETENGNVETENAEVYDLSGRRVQNAKKGIFVINGKVVVK